MVGHACLDLRNSARNVVAKVFIASLSHEYYVFDTHTADLLLVFADQISVQVAQIELVELCRDLSIEEEVTEVAAGLDRDDVVGLDDASSANVGKSRLSCSLRSVG